MATSSRLKTVDGKYYATEEFVKQYVDENLNREILSGNVGNAISGTISGTISEQVTPKIDELQTNINEVQEIIVNQFTMNTL